MYYKDDRVESGGEVYVLESSDEIIETVLSSYAFKNSDLERMSDNNFRAVSDLVSIAGSSVSLALLDSTYESKPKKRLTIKITNDADIILVPVEIKYPKNYYHSQGISTIYNDAKDSLVLYTDDLNELDEIEFHFVAITTDDTRAQIPVPNSNVNPDIYQAFFSRDIPDIYIKLKYIDQELHFSTFKVDTKEVSVPKHSDESFIEYAAFRGLSEAMSPSFGVSFFCKDRPVFLQDNIEVDMVFIHSKKITFNPDNNSSDTLLKDLGEGSGLGVDYAKILAIDMWTSLKLQERETTTRNSSLANVSLSLSMVSSVYASYNDAIAGTRENIKMVHNVKIINYLDCEMCIDNVEYFKTVTDSNIPIIKSGEIFIMNISSTKLNPFFRKNIDFSFRQNTIDKTNYNFFRCVIDSTNKMNIRVREIMDYENNKLIGEWSTEPDNTTMRIQFLRHLIGEIKVGHNINGKDYNIKKYISIASNNLVNVNAGIIDILFV